MGSDCMYVLSGMASKNYVGNENKVSTGQGTCDVI